MTPGARVAAAIAVLDGIIEGLAPEQALTRWARQSRFAGSKDRAAVRDHVFDALRQRETAACMGGGSSGRALMIGLLRAQGAVPEQFFTAEGHAPPRLSAEETAALPADGVCADLWNIPGWLVSEFERSLGAKASATAKALQQRAPVTLRVNVKRTTRSSLVRALKEEGVECVENRLSETALTVTEGERRLRNSKLYETGLFEFQDAASQAVVDALPQAAKCLDYCAGGGGKALAMAARPGRDVFAHDLEPARMKDIAARAARAGVTITQLKTTQLRGPAPYDLVLCDVPCSGSGSWRRSPGAKWTFSPERLVALCATQDAILVQAARLTAPQGTLAYVTCSVLHGENEARVDAFLERNPDWTCTFQRRFDVCAEGDGFYTAHLTRA